MTKYFWNRVLIHGSEPSNNERTVFCIIAMAILVLTMWLDPCRMRRNTKIQTAADLVMEMRVDVNDNCQIITRNHNK